jgi:hypothetical protein
VTGVEQGQNIAFLNEVSHHLLSAAAASTNQTPAGLLRQKHRAQHKRHGARKRNPNFAHSCMDAHLRARRRRYLLLALQTPSSRGQISQLFLPPNAPFMERSLCKEKKCPVLMHALLRGSKGKRMGRISERRNAASLMHTGISPCLL